MILSQVLSALSLKLRYLFIEDVAYLVYQGWSFCFLPDEIAVTQVVMLMPLLLEV